MRTRRGLVLAAVTVLCGASLATGVVRAAAGTQPVDAGPDPLVRLSVQTPNGLVAYLVDPDDRRYTRTDAVTSGTYSSTDSLVLYDHTFLRRSGDGREYGLDGYPHGLGVLATPAEVAAALTDGRAEVVRGGAPAGERRIRVLVTPDGGVRDLFVDSADQVRGASETYLGNGTRTTVTLVRRTPAALAELDLAVPAGYADAAAGAPVARDVFCHPQDFRTTVTASPSADGAGSDVTVARVYQGTGECDDEGAGDPPRVVVLDAAGDVVMDSWAGCDTIGFPCSTVGTGYGASPGSSRPFTTTWAHTYLDGLPAAPGTYTAVASRSSDVAEATVQVG